MQIQSDFGSSLIWQAVPAPPVSQSTPNAGQVRNAVNEINAGELLGFDREMRFSTDPQSKLGIVQILSRSTGEVITQIPSQLILELAQALKSNH